MTTVVLLILSIQKMFNGASKKSIHGRQAKERYLTYRKNSYYVVLHSFANTRMVIVR